MTTSRVVRGRKIFICASAILVLIGLVACFNNVLVQLQKTRSDLEACQQHEDNLSSNYEILNDYKMRLESSLKHEKEEHTKTKTNFEKKLALAKANSERDTNEAELRFNSLKQHSDLQETEFNDFKEATEKKEKNQLGNIQSLQTQLDKIRGELEMLQKNYEAIDDQKEQMLRENHKLAEELETTKKDSLQTIGTLHHELNEYKKQCAQIEPAIEANDVVNPVRQNDTLKKMLDENKGGEIENVPDKPSIVIKVPRKSSTPKTGPNVLNGAKPIVGPLVSSTSNSPRMQNNFLPLPLQLKNRPGEPNEAENKGVVNDRYKNEIEENQVKKNDAPVEKKIENAEDNVNFEGAGFGDKPDDNKLADSIDAPKEDKKKVEANPVGLEYKDNDMDAVDDDDPEVYEDRGAQLNEPAIRN